MVINFNQNNMIEIGYYMTITDSYTFGQASIIIQAYSLEFDIEESIFVW